MATTAMLESISLTGDVGGKGTRFTTSEPSRQTKPMSRAGTADKAEFKKLLEAWLMLSSSWAACCSCSLALPPVHYTVTGTYGLRQAFKIAARSNNQSGSLAYQAVVWLCQGCL